MKIVFSTFTYYPEKNGVANVTKYITEGLSQKGYDVHVITMQNETLTEKPTITNQKVSTDYHNKIIVHKLSSKNSISPSKKEYLELLASLNPDVFVCVCTQTWTFDMLANSNWTGILPERCKKILYTHDFSGLYKYPGNESNILIKTLKKIKFKAKWSLYYKKNLRLMKDFNVITHLSVANISYLYCKKYIFANNKTKNVVLGNAIEEVFFTKPVFEKYSSSLASTNLSIENKFRIIYVANYHKIKNQKELITAFYESTQLNNAELILAGNNETEYYNTLCTYAQHLATNKTNTTAGINKHITFTIGKSRTELSQLMSTCDICVIPSHWEAYSLSLLEALAKGLPVITTNVGNARLIPGTITIQSREEMVYAMEFLATHPNIRAEMGRLGHLYAKEYARISVQVDKFEKIIN